MNRAQLFVFGAVTALFGFLLGYLAGSPRSDAGGRRGAAVSERVRPASVAAGERGRAVAAVQRRAAAPAARRSAAVRVARSAVGEAVAASEGDALAGEARPATGASRLEALLAVPQEGEADAAAWAAQRVARDPALAERALERWRTETDPATLERLAAVLAAVGTPAVEQAALEAVGSEDAARRAAALELLDRLDTPRALEVVGPLLSRSVDPDTVARALYALPPAAGLSEQRVAGLRREIERLARSAREPEVRRRALMQLAEYGGPDAEAICVQALGAPEPAVRAAAAFALERLRPRSPAAIAALAARLSDPAEDRTVRENAFAALSVAGPLPEPAHRAYEAYQLEREGG